MGDELSVTTNRSLAAVKKGRADDVVSILSPVDVWLVAFVAALLPESVFVCPGEVSVPTEEVALPIVSDCKVQKERSLLTVAWILSV